MLGVIAKSIVKNSIMRTLSVVGLNPFRREKLLDKFRRSAMSVPSPLLQQVTCPHCWHKFPPEDIFWISSHPDLDSDPICGSGSQLRFQPTQFSLRGQAIDERGDECKDLACPQCHLGICRSLLEMEPLFISILGAPGSGKSSFLTSMVRQLEKN